jgi:hypothetical protein
MTTSLQPVKSWKKPVEVVKVRILAGWAQKSPEPWWSLSLSLSATAYTYTFKNVVMKVDVTWHKPSWSPRKEYFLQFVPHQATSAWTELSCGLPNQFADLEAQGFSGAVTMLERRSCRQASSSKLWHPSLLASWALVRDGGFTASGSCVVQQDFLLVPNDSLE